MNDKADLKVVVRSPTVSHQRHVTLARRANNGLLKLPTRLAELGAELGDACVDAFHLRGERQPGARFMRRR